MCANCVGLLGFNDLGVVAVSFTLQCNRCGRHSKDQDDYKNFKQLDYYGKGIGHYHTVHLCPLCHKAFEKLFMKGKPVLPNQDVGDDTPG